MSNGNFASGDGTTSNPYLIEDAADLNAVRNNLTKAYKLIKDINLDIAPYNTGEGWNPIGTPSIYFTGIFDGNGHIIKSLYINKPNSSNIGLFGAARDSTVIKNIGLEDINITGKGMVGGLIGVCIYNTKLINCYTKGKIVSNSGFYIGGLLGESNYCTVTNCYSSVNLSGGYETNGGLIGRINNGSVSNCYSNGKIISIYSNEKGGLIGYNTTTVVHSYWDKEASGIAVSAGGTGLTTVQMKTPSSFVGWDAEVLEDGVTKVWILKDGEYPKLWFEKSPAKYLIKQQDNYYTLQSNGSLQLLGIPTDNNQLEQWFNNNGIDNINDLCNKYNTESFVSSGEALGDGKLFTFDVPNNIKNINNVD